MNDCWSRPSTLKRQSSNTCTFYITATVSVTYVICFVIANAVKWGINVDFSGNTDQPFYVPGMSYNCLYADDQLSQIIYLLFFYQL